MSKDASLLLVLTFPVFLQPSHLDRFQLAFRRTFRIVLEICQLGDPLVQVGIADVGGIQIREFLIQGQRDVVGSSQVSAGIRFWFLSKRLELPCSSCSQPA